MCMCKGGTHLFRCLNADVSGGERPWHGVKVSVLTGGHHVSVLRSRCLKHSTPSLIPANVRMSTINWHGKQSMHPYRLLLQ